jgi:hypothetical protein
VLQQGGTHSSDKSFSDTTEVGAPTQPNSHHSCALHTFMHAYDDAKWNKKVLGRFFALWYPATTTSACCCANSGLLQSANTNSYCLQCEETNSNSNLPTL